MKKTMTLSLALLMATPILLQSTVSAAKNVSGGKAGVTRGVQAFPLGGFVGPVQLAPGRYEQYQVDRIEKALIDNQFNVDSKDIEYIKSELTKVNGLLSNLNNVIYSEEKGMMKKYISQFRGYGSIDDLTEYMGYAAQVKRLQNEILVVTGGLAAVPTMLAKKGLTIQGPTSVFSTSREGVQLDMAPLQEHVKNQFANILAEVNERKFTFQTEQGLLNLTGLNLNVDPKDTINIAELYQSLLKKADRLISDDADFAMILKNFNLVGRQMLQGLIKVYGTDQEGLGRVVNIDQKGLESWMENAGMYYFVRSRIRLQYGIRMGVPAVKGLKAQNFYTEFLKGVKPLQFENGEFPRNDQELGQIRKNIFDQLTLAGTQADFGKSPITKENSLVFSTLSVFNYLRSAVTGKLLTAKMNAAALALLYLDIDEELMAEKLDSSVTLKAAFAKRYITGKSPEEKNKAALWNCTVSNMVKGAQGPSSCKVGDQIFEINTNMFSSDSNLRIIRDMIMTAFNGKLANAEQASRIRASAQALMESTKTFKDNANRSNAIDDMFSNP